MWEVIIAQHLYFQRRLHRPRIDIAKPAVDIVTLAGIRYHRTRVALAIIIGAQPRLIKKAIGIAAGVGIAKHRQPLVDVCRSCCQPCRAVEIALRHASAIDACAVPGEEISRRIAKEIVIRMHLALRTDEQLLIECAVIALPVKLDKVPRLHRSITHRADPYRHLLPPVKELVARRQNTRHRDTRIDQIGMRDAVNPIFSHRNLIILLVKVDPFLPVLGKGKQW